MRKRIENLLYWVLKIFGGEGFSTRNLPAQVLMKYFLVQKVLRINGHVPWAVHWTSTVNAPQNIVHGTRSPGLSKGCHLDGRNGILIEENVWVGPRVSVISMNHDVHDFHSYVDSKPVVIKRNSWLGANAVVLPGVELGEHTIVAAGAVVTKSFPDGDQVLAGNPAMVVKNLNRYRE